MKVQAKRQEKKRRRNEEKSKKKKKKRWPAHTQRNKQPASQFRQHIMADDDGLEKGRREREEWEKED
jgi:hypothetical protein